MCLSLCLSVSWAIKWGFRCIVAYEGKKLGRRGRGMAGMTFVRHSHTVIFILFEMLKLKRDRMLETKWAQTHTRERKEYLGLSYTLSSEINVTFYYYYSIRLYRRQSTLCGSFSMTPNGIIFHSFAHSQTDTRHDKPYFLSLSLRTIPPRSRIYAVSAFASEHQLFRNAIATATDTEISFSKKEYFFFFYFEWFIVFCHFHSVLVFYDFLFRLLTVVALRLPHSHSLYAFRSPQPLRDDITSSRLYECGGELKAQWNEWKKIQKTEENSRRRNSWNVCWKCQTQVSSHLKLWVSGCLLLETC